jgi:hypothetical protein
MGPPHCAPLRHYYCCNPYDGWENAYRWRGHYGPRDDWGALSYPYSCWAAGEAPPLATVIRSQSQTGR